MNKKFSTLLAGVMLASAFSVSAAMENGKSYLLKSGSNYLSAETNKTSAAYGKLVYGSLDVNSLSDVVAGTWKVSTKTTSGAVVYTFVNKVTGMTLAVDPTTAKTATNGLAGDVTLGSGTISEWAFDSNYKMYSYFKSDSIVYFDNNGKLNKGKISELSSALAISEDVISTPIVLNANDLNTLMRSVDSSDNFFALNMNPEVSTGKANHLTATGLHAVAISGSQFIKLQAKDKKLKDQDGKDQDAYVVVDTAYYEGTETSGQLLKYDYDLIGAANREPGSYNFKFTYNVKDDKLYVQVEKVVDQLTAGQLSLSADGFKEYVKNNNNSTWTGSDVATRSNKYIYMAKLDGTNVLTVNTDKTEGSNGNTPASQNITIKTSADYSSLTLTTLPDGVYLIQYKSTGGHLPKQNNAYAIANLAGDFGWTAQARNQDFNHMPAAQWVVNKKGTSSIAPISITNREFDDQTPWNIPSDVQLFAVSGQVDQVFYFYGGSKDTVSFVKVADELVKDTKLGYKYVTENEAKVQTYLFNYLHGLAENKYLNTPSDKDSIVRVDENGAKTNFRLELVVKDDKYGYKDGLVRNAYYITDGKGRYLSFDSDKEKYMMKSYPTAYFLKENNCKDGADFYSLIEVRYAQAVSTDDDYATYRNDSYYNGYWGYSFSDIDPATGVTYYYYGANDKDGNRVIADGTFDAYLYKQNSTNGKFEIKKVGSVSTYKSYDYASVKASVDDNTLDLTRGILNDKFSSEIRTSAFAVAMDDSPLYRRFNNAALGESIDAPDSLAFVESIRNEYLMDEWNKNLTAENVDYAGIWNKDKADGKLFFHVDTTWVNRGLGNIKPQYLISVARDDQEGTPGIPCTYEHNHFDNAGNQVDAAHCSHATLGHAGFAYGKYLVNFSDSAQALIDRKVSANPYMFTTNTSSNSAYTRVGFVKAIHAGDSLFVLTNGFETMDPSKLDTATIIANYKKAKLENFIVDLVGDNHKNVTWSFRYINPDNVANVTEEGANNSFLFESNVYGDDADNNIHEYYRTVIGGAAEQAIAPASGAAWLKMHNGCLVLTDRSSSFNAAKTGGDGALVFNVDRMTKDDEFVTSIDGANAEGVTILAGNGTVTVQGAAGQSVVITNILGKVVAETVLTSDNATISVPAGIVAVAVDGEEAVKVIVK